MKKSHFVASVMSKIDLPIRELEKGLKASQDPSVPVPKPADLSLPGFENIGWQFVTITVGGEIEIVFANRWNRQSVPVTLPAAATFLISCTQSSDGTRVMEFGPSLS